MEVTTNRIITCLFPGDKKRPGDTGVQIRRHLQFCKPRLQLRRQPRQFYFVPVIAAKEIFFFQ